MAVNIVLAFQEILTVLPKYASTKDTAAHQDTARSPSRGRPQACHALFGMAWTSPRAQTWCPFFIVPCASPAASFTALLNCRLPFDDQ